MGVPGLRAMGACGGVLGRLGPSVFVCPVGSFVAEAVRAPPPRVALLVCTHLQIRPLRH